MFGSRVRRSHCQGSLLIFPTTLTIAGRTWHLPARAESLLDARWLPGLHRAVPSAPLDEVFSCAAKSTRVSRTESRIRGPGHPASEVGRGGSGDGKVPLTVGWTQALRAVAVSHGTSPTTGEVSCSSRCSVPTRTVTKICSPVGPSVAGSRVQSTLNR